MEFSIEAVRKMSAMKKNEMALKAEYLALADSFRIVNRLNPHSVQAKIAHDDMKIAHGEWESVRDNFIALLEKTRKEQVF